MCCAILDVCMSNIRTDHCDVVEAVVVVANVESHIGSVTSDCGSDGWCGVVAI